MPEPTMNTGFDFKDAPGAELSLDDIFAADPADPNTGNEQNSTDPAATGPETFLQTATGTVYKSKDDAVKGIEHKDALITELRQKLAEQNGQDPLKKNREERPVSYSENPDRYFKDMKEARTEQDLLNVQKKFVEEQLAPYAPLIASMAKSRAIEETAAEIPEINTFVRSDGYKQTLDKYPLLKNSIEMGENNPQVSGDLGQLYKMAYTLSLGLNPSKITSSVRTEPVTVRPTVASGTPTAPSVANVTPASLNTKAGRETIIKEQMDRGVMDLRF